MRTTATNIRKRDKPAIGQREFKTARAVEVDSALREIQFVASDETIDRYGDVIRADGWELENFKRNPTLLFGHDQGSLPIGTVTALETKGKQLLARAKFLAEGIYPFADQVWKVIEAGALRACSVGFIPLEVAALTDADGDVSGFDYVRSDLIELSITPVGANPMALAIGKALKIDNATMRRIFVDAHSDDRALTLQRAALDARVRATRMLADAR